MLPSKLRFITLLKLLSNDIAAQLVDCSPTDARPAHLRSPSVAQAAGAAPKAVNIRPPHSAAVPTLDQLAGQPQRVKTCYSAGSHAAGCGFPGVTPQQCEDLGCCFDSSNPDEHWCFFPNDPPDWNKTYPATFYGANQGIPTLSSPLGTAHVAWSGDMAGVACLAMPPYAQECDQSGGGQAAAYGFPYGLSINGTLLQNLTTRWLPYGVERTAYVAPGALAGGLAGTVVNTTAMLWSDSPVLMVALYIVVPPNLPAFNITAVLPGMVRNFSTSQWPWNHPYPGANPADFNVTLMPDPNVPVAVWADKQSQAFAGVAVSHAAIETALVMELAPLGPGGGSAPRVTWTVQNSRAVPWTVKLGFVLAIGNSSQAAAALAGRVADDFWTWQASALYEWADLWDAVFRPNNTRFSGHLPALSNATSPALASVYYGSVVSLLQVMRNRTALLPSGGVPALANLSWVVPSAGAIEGVTDTYLWDTSMIARVMTLLQPKEFLNHISTLLNIGIHSHYALDYVSGAGVGPWYSFNDISMFTILDTYAETAVSGGGLAFYNSTVSGKRVIEWMDELAVYWQNLVPGGNGSTVGLADYGGASNLLECVPTYIHKVPSLNAANVYMMNRTAGVWAALGNTTRAAQLAQWAQQLQALVMGLYVDGKGYWACEQLDGTLVIGPARASEMLAFLQSQLLVPTWMRALSLNDPAANASDRNDHGPNGAYDGWPARTVQALAELGFASEARALLEAVAPVLLEGPFGQAHHIFRNPDAPSLPVVKAGPTGEQEYNAACAGAFANVMLQMLARDPAAFG